MYVNKLGGGKTNVTFVRHVLSHDVKNKKFGHVFNKKTNQTFYARLDSVDVGKDQGRRDSQDSISQIYT